VVQHRRVRRRCGGYPVRAASGRDRRDRARAGRDTANLVGASRLGAPAACRPARPATARHWPGVPQPGETAGMPQPATRRGSGRAPRRGTRYRHSGRPRSPTCSPYSSVAFWAGLRQRRDCGVVLPSRARGRVASRALRRSAAARLHSPCRHGMPMARLRRLASEAECGGSSMTPHEVKPVMRCPHSPRPREPAPDVKRTSVSAGRC
jgi:hypothetical protein